MSYDSQIKQLELEATLHNQMHSRTIAQAKILKLKKEEDRLKKTVEDLDVEIPKTKKEIEKLTNQDTK